MNLKKLKIGPGFIEAFGRDVDFEDTWGQSAYLDLETGEMLWVYEDDEEAEWMSGISAEENQVIRKRTEAEPERYLEIQGLTHGDHHETLKEFLDSEWTEDEKLAQLARESYSGSIGGWRDTVNNDHAVHSYFKFRERKIESMAEDFLRENGIEPEWE
jgi:hypothetical protein